MAHCKKYLLLYTLLPLIVLMVSTSYYRFLVAQDYTIGYEGECDPYTEHCYVYCEDEVCEEPFYYSWIERNAGIVYDLCGPLVTECDAAYACPADELDCKITFCNNAVDDCDTLGPADTPIEVSPDSEAIINVAP
jgi:hypothetical protein